MKGFKELMKELLNKENNEKTLIVCWNKKIYDFNIKYLYMFTIETFRKIEKTDGELVWKII